MQASRPTSRRTTPSLPRSASEPFDTSSFITVVRRGGVDRRVATSPHRGSAPDPSEEADTFSTPVDVRDRTDDRRAVARTLVARGLDEQVGVGLVGDHVTEGVLQRRGEDAHAHDQGEADHQGSSRRRRTTRVAHRVLLRQLTGQPAPAERLGRSQRRADVRRRAARSSRRPARRAGRHRTASWSRRRTASSSITVTPAPVSPNPITARRDRRLLRSRGRLAQRLDRQHLRRAASRHECRHHGDQGADQHRDPDGAGLELQRRARQAEARPRPSAA